MDKLVELIKNSNHCVFLSGAGISTLSGIPDFRGKDGIYSKFDPELIFSLDHFYKEPEYFYSNSIDLIYNLDEKEPNIIHKTLTKMEEKGIVKCIVTQNIDMLHQKAGSENVIEIHGSPKYHTCLSCSTKYPYDMIAEIVNTGDIPICQVCCGLVKPDIIFFGEMMDEEATERAFEECSKADLIVVIGTSLVVQPAATLPCYTLKNGGKLVIVNNMQTPLDRFACLKYESLEEVFAYLNENLL